jgi:hypothetical protein
MTQFPADIDLLTDMVAFSLNAVDGYLEMTGDGCAWDTPELWIQSEVARKIREKHRLLVWLEPGIEKVLGWLNHGTDIPLTLQGLRTTGFLDIALFEPANVMEQSDFRGIMEIKSGITKGTECDKDADRIRNIGMLSAHFAASSVARSLGKQKRLLKGWH